MSKYVDIHYCVSYGRLDTSDWCDESVELTDEEEAIYDRAVFLRKDLNEIPELEAAISRAYDDIEAEAISMDIENEDEYVMECQGVKQMDPDEINDKVNDRDPHTLEFFGLTDMTEEELDAWDANDVEMPIVRDFDEDFEPYSPYDEGYDLIVRYINPKEKEKLPENEACAILKELFRTANGNYKEVKDFVSQNDHLFVPADHAMKLQDLAAAVAAEMGMRDYQQK